MALQLELWKKKRKELNLKYEDLAQKAQVSLNTVKNIFRGTTTDPRLETVQAIERALELNTQAIQYTDEEKAAGVGAHGTNLSNEEWDWLELRSAIIEAKGEKGLRAIQTIIQTYLGEK